MPGQDFAVQVKVTAPAGVKWIRLRYRHVNQKEDYQTADMALDAQTGLYAARIPASFIDPHWDLMYFVEVVDSPRQWQDLSRFGSGNAVHHRKREALADAGAAAVIFPGQ